MIDASTIEDLDYASYKDSYVEKLTKVIQTKVDGEEVVQVPDPEEPKIVNLMDALKQSVARAQAGDVEATTAKKKAAKKTAARKKAPAKKKMAPSAKPKTKTTRRKKSG